MPSCQYRSNPTATASDALVVNQISPYTSVFTFITHSEPNLIRMRVQATFPFRTFRTFYHSSPNRPDKNACLRRFRIPNIINFTSLAYYLRQGRETGYHDQPVSQVIDKRASVRHTCLNAITPLLKKVCCRPVLTIIVMWIKVRRRPIAP